MSQYLPPMAGGQNSELVPGPWRHDWCPKPTEIVVIEVRKVFDFCFQEDVLERCFFEPRLTNTGTITGCEITNVTCSEILDREPIPDSDGLALVSIQVNLTLNITVVPSPGAEPVVVTRSIAFPKRVVLCAPMGTDVVCEVRGTCICTPQPPLMNGGTTTDPNVCCTIQLCIVVKSVADINVLVPTFGIVVPKECQVAQAFGGCPPLPPQQCREFSVPRL